MARTVWPPAAAPHLVLPRPKLCPKCPREIGNKPEGEAPPPWHIHKSMTSHPEQTLSPPARARGAQARGHAPCLPPSRAAQQLFLPGPASWGVWPLGNWRAVRRALQEEPCLSSPLSLAPPPPSTADSSHPSTGLTCFHGNRNPGLRQPLVLPPVITSSLKCKAS